MIPRYPVYIPSKGRAGRCATAALLQGVPYSLVVEAEEAEDYRAAYPEATVLVLPFSGRGAVTPARNWIKQHARDAGYRRHWQLDDNVQQIYLRDGKRLLSTDAGLTLSTVADFCDRFSNIAIAGLRSSAFPPPPRPFSLNQQVYWIVLVDNATPYEWRGRGMEDTDYSLQCLAGGYCTVLFNVYCAAKPSSGTTPGGHTDAAYSGDGRAAVARELERRWPGMVRIERKWGRPKHSVAHLWRKIDTPLLPVSIAADPP